VTVFAKGYHKKEENKHNVDDENNKEVV